MPPFSALQLGASVQRGFSVSHHTLLRLSWIWVEGCGNVVYGLEAPKLYFSSGMRIADSEPPRRGGKIEEHLNISYGGDVGGFLNGQMGYSE